MHPILTRSQCAAVGLFLLALVTTYFLFPHAVKAQNEVRATGIYTDWYFPSSASGYTNFGWDVTVKNDPSPQSYFYSTQFWFLVDGEATDGGYFGIQTQGANPTGKIAIFSLWNTLDARGPEFAGTFGGEGVGYSVRISYPWVVNRTYHLRIGKLDTDADGQWWGAWIKDTTTQVESYVGKIKTHLSETSLYGIPTSWTEYYGQNPSACSGYNLSDVLFSNVTANNGSLASNGLNNHLGNPVYCPGSSFVEATNGVRQQVGTILSVAANPDLTSPSGTTVVPAAGTVGQAVTFSGALKNIGDGPATKSPGFPNTFQVVRVDPTSSTQVTTGTGQTIKVNLASLVRVAATPTITSLGKDESKTVSASYTFNSANAYAVRLCANVNTEWNRDASVVDQNTNNDCGDWVSLAVSEPAAPVLRDPSTPTFEEYLSGIRASYGLPENWDFEAAQPGATDELWETYRQNYPEAAISERLSQSVAPVESSSEMRAQTVSQPVQQQTDTQAPVIGASFEAWTRTNTAGYVPPRDEGGGDCYRVLGAGSEGGVGCVSAGDLQPQYQTYLDALTKKDSQGRPVWGTEIPYEAPQHYQEGVGEEANTGFTNAVGVERFGSADGKTTYTRIGDPTWLEGNSVYGQLLPYLIYDTKWGYGVPTIPFEALKAQVVERSNQGSFLDSLGPFIILAPLAMAFVGNLAFAGAEAAGAATAAMIESGTVGTAGLALETTALAPSFLSQAKAAFTTIRKAVSIVNVTKSVVSGDFSLGTLLSVAGLPGIDAIPTELAQPLGIYGQVRQAENIITTGRIDPLTAIGYGLDIADSGSAQPQQTDTQTGYPISEDRAVTTPLVTEDIRGIPLDPEELAYVAEITSPRFGFEESEDGPVALLSREQADALEDIFGPPSETDDAADLAIDSPPAESVDTATKTDVEVSTVLSRQTYEQGVETLRRDALSSRNERIEVRVVRTNGTSSWISLSESDFTAAADHITFSRSALDKFVRDEDVARVDVVHTHPLRAITRDWETVAKIESGQVRALAMPPSTTDILDVAVHQEKYFGDVAYKLGTMVVVDPAGVWEAQIAESPRSLLAIRATLEKSTELFDRLAEREDATRLLRESAGTHPALLLGVLQNAKTRLSPETVKILDDIDKTLEGITRDTAWMRFHSAIEFNAGGFDVLGDPAKLEEIKSIYRDIGVNLTFTPHQIPASDTSAGSGGGIIDQVVDTVTGALDAATQTVTGFIDSITGEPADDVGPSDVGGARENVTLLEYLKVLNEGGTEAEAESAALQILSRFDSLVPSQDETAFDVALRLQKDAAPCPADDSSCDSLNNSSREGYNRVGSGINFTTGGVGSQIFEEDLKRQSELFSEVYRPRGSTRAEVNLVRDRMNNFLRERLGIKDVEVSVRGNPLKKTFYFEIIKRY